MAVAGALMLPTAALAQTPNPELSVSDATANESAGTMTFTLTLDEADTGNVVVQYDTSNGTAVAGADYTRTTGSVTFTPGQTSKQVTVPILQDSVDENNETFSLFVSQITGARLGDGVGTGTIIDDDASPTISISDTSVNEGNSSQSNGTLTVSLSQASGRTVTVSYATSDGTAQFGDSDYVQRNGTINFAPGTTSQTIPVSAVGDTRDEPNEVFHYTLSNAINATIADAQGTVTIIDDDNPATIPTLSITDASVTEGNSGTTAVTLTVSMSQATTNNVSFQYTTQDGTATFNGGDYNSQNGTRVIEAGTTTEVISFNVQGDLIDESNETFNVLLSNATNATIADAQGVITILDDDPSQGTPSLSINDVSVTEGNSGTTTATATVTLSQASSSPVTFSFATGGGTATAGSDHTAASGSRTIAAGQTTATIAVGVLGDTLDEPNETFNITLSNASGATIADGQGVVTIIDDDPAGTTPALSINDVSVNEGNAGTTAVTLTVSLSQATSNPVTFNYATQDGTASFNGGDYNSQNGTRTIAAGQTSTTITINVQGDTVDEANETFNVVLSNASGATIADATGVVTIFDDDAAPVTPTISISDTTVTEGDSGERLATFTLTLSQATNQTVTVNFETADGTARFGDGDFWSTSGTRVFEPGQTTRTVQIRVVGDRLDESNETFSVNLSSPTNATLADAQGVGTILDDDRGGGGGGELDVSRLSMTITRQERTLKIDGKLRPAHNGRVSVKLFKRRNGRFVRIGSKRPRLTASSEYHTKFARPSGGVCKIKARWAGDNDHLPSRVVGRFRC